jgi:stage V sporulation protein D (sporulation-specific penicillin-binding protein)
MWKNKAISTINEPGSVFKVFTSSAVLEEKTESFDSTFTCGGFYEVLGERISCHDPGGHGLSLLTFKEALANSCNPSFMQMGLKLGYEKFSYYADAFGLREKTGIDLPGEVNSFFASEEGLENDVTLASSSFGQTNSLTAIQMITGYTAAINGGYLLQPYVVDSIVDTEGNIVKKTEKRVKRQVISEETSALMREALQNNVDSKNTGNAYISGYKIGGKSGTAEKLNKLSSDKAKYEKEKTENPDKAATLPAPVKQYVASYCAFAPADNPEIVVYVAVDEPDQTIGFFGSAVAAPCVRQIMENVLPYLGYYPEYTEDELLNIDIRIPDVEDMDVELAVEEIEKLGFEADIRGEGNIVTAQVPSFTSSMPVGGKVILYTESEYTTKEIILPDLKNMNIKQVNDLFAKLGLNLKTTGSQSEKAIVFSQSVPGNTVVEEGTIVSVHFGINTQTG